MPVLAGRLVLVSMGITIVLAKKETLSSFRVLQTPTVTHSESMTIHSVPIEY